MQERINQLTEEFDRLWRRNGRGVMPHQYEEYALEKAAYFAVHTYDDDRYVSLFEQSVCAFATSIVNVVPIAKAIYLFNKYFPEDNDSLRQIVLDRIYKAYQAQWQNAARCAHMAKTIEEATR